MVQGLGLGLGNNYLMGGGVMKKFYAVMIGTVEVIAEGETYERCSIKAELVNNWFEVGHPCAPYKIQDFHPSECPKFHMSYHESAVNGSRYIQAFGRIERVNL